MQKVVECIKKSDIEKSKENADVLYSNELEYNNKLGSPAIYFDAQNFHNESFPKLVQVLKFRHPDQQMRKKIESYIQMKQQLQARQPQFQVNNNQISQQQHEVQALNESNLKKKQQIHELTDDINEMRSEIQTYQQILQHHLPPSPSINSSDYQKEQLTLQNYQKRLHQIERDKIQHIARQYEKIIQWERNKMNLEEKLKNTNFQRQKMKKKYTTIRNQLKKRQLDVRQKRQIVEKQHKVNMKQFNLPLGTKRGKNKQYMDAEGKNETSYRVFVKETNQTIKIVLILWLCILILISYGIS